MTESMAPGFGSEGRTYHRRRDMSVRALGALWVALALGQLSGCASWTDAAPERVADARAGVPDNWREAPSTAADAAALEVWWAGFDDPALTALIEQALTANNDIAAAEGRLRTARAAVMSARGARLPGVTAGQVELGGLHEESQ